MTRRNLFWFVAITLLITFHGCVWLQWQQEQDEQDRTTMQHDAKHE